MPKKIGLAIVIAVAALAGYFIYENYLKGFGYFIPGGLTRTYSFNVSSETQIDIGVLKMDPSKSAGESLSGKAISVKSLADGVLALKFYKNPKGGWDVAGSLKKAGILINGKAPGWTWALDYPFTFRMDKQGAVSQPAFTPGIPDEAVSFISNLIYKFQAVLPAKQQPSWSVDEISEHGDAQVAYAELSWDKKTKEMKVKKTRRSFKNLAQKNSNISFLANPSMNIIKSETIIDITLSGWIKELESYDSFAFLSDGRPWSKSDSHVLIKLTDIKTDSFPARFSGFQDMMQSQKLLQNALTHTDPVLDKIASDLSLQGSLQKYFEMIKTDRAAAERFLVNYLRLHPDASAELLKLLDSDRDMKIYDEKTQLFLWRLIVESGTIEAQRAIMNAALDPSFGRTSHIRAIIYAAGFENPQKFMAEEMLKLHRNPALNADEKLQRMTENMSLLAVGSMGYRDKLNVETKELVAKELTDNLRNSRDNSSETALTLKAIGNTGNNSLLETVRPYFNNPDELVRKAAAESLRRMDIPAAQTQLINLYKKDESVAVREEALKSLQETPVTKESAAWARQAVMNAKTPNETALVIEILGKTINKYSENEAALRELLASNPSLPMKETIYKFIAPK